MLNFIWPFFLIISFIYAIFTGKVSEINNSIFASTENAINLTINLFGTMCLWNGIMRNCYEDILIAKIN